MSTAAAVQRKPPAGRPALSTKSAPVGRKSGAAIKRPPANGVRSNATTAAGRAGGAVNGAVPHLSPYEVMASRLANRVAEMAESITFIERQQKPQAPQEPVEQAKKKPRKLELRLQGSSPDSVAFSAPFLDNTLKKMLELQNKMLKVSADIAAAEGVSEETKKEQFSQTSELSRIIALICAEKARQGA